MKQAPRGHEAKVNVVALGLLLLGGCGAGTAPVLDGSRKECAVTLAPRPSATPPQSAPMPVPPAPESQVTVHAEVPMAPLQRTLEERVPQRLAEGRVRIGPGGTVSYSVQRGALSLRVSRSALLIEAPVHAKAQACRGDDCYASCEPEARVVAEVPLMLRPDYRFQKTSVSLTFSRGCKVRALGGFFTLDVTPTLEAQLAPELDKAAREIDGQLPDLKSRIAEAWSELAAPRQLPLSGCFVLQPFGVIQGPFTPSTSVLSARFAVQAHPELRTSCGAAPPAVPLPPLTTNASLPDEGVVRLGMVTPLGSVARAFESAQAVQGSGKRLRVTRADVVSRGRDVDAQLALTGDVCGDLAFTAALDFSGEHIRLARTALWPGEGERAASSRLEPDQLTQALAGAVRIAPLLSVQAFKDAAPPLAAGASQPGLEVRATVSSARAAGAVARGDELVAWLEARGAIWLKSDVLR
jgi:hypothetical protein